jgi:hypothetical protein
MNESEKLFELKEELCKERDLCAELCNVWITRLYQNQNNKKEYDTYMKMINDMEPYTQGLKAKISEINKAICNLENVESIDETEYIHQCVSKYGFDAPKT